VHRVMDSNAYPKAGAPSRIADVFVYDVAAGRKTQLDVRDGKPFTDIPADGSAFLNDNIGPYVYAIRWSPDGTELFLNRTNRRQNMMDFAACSPSTGKCRVVAHEKWKPTWAPN